VTAAPGDDGTGYNFLLHNMVRLPDTQGAWALVRGGMGNVTAALADAARRAGAVIETETAVASVDTSSGTATGVTLADGTRVPARAVVVNADPLTLGRVVDALPAAARSEVDRVVAASTPATTAKLNLCLSALPSFACVAGDVGQHRTTTHLLVGADTPRAAAGAMDGLTRAAHAARSGVIECEVGAHPPIEFYFSSVADPSVRDDAGRHSAALFVQLAPALADAEWTEDVRADYTRRLLDVVAAWAPDIHGCVHDARLLAPPDLEAAFGIATRHIHHITNTLPLDARFPTVVPGIDGLFSASAGTHPGGSVAGCAGYLAARAAGAALGVKVKEVVV
jgi:phytoene dehydrogenase-like protein